MEPTSRRSLKPVKCRVMVKSRWHMADAQCQAVSVNEFVARTSQEFSVGEPLECAIDLPDVGQVHCDGKAAQVTSRQVEDIIEHDYEIKIVQIDQANEEKLRKWLGDAAPPAARRAPPPRAAPAPRPGGRAAPAPRPGGVAPTARPAPAAGRQPTAGAPGGKGKRMDPRELQRVLQQLKKKRGG